MAHTLGAQLQGGLGCVAWVGKGWRVVHKPVGLLPLLADGGVGLLPLLADGGVRLLPLLAP